MDFYKGIKKTQFNYFLFLEYSPYYFEYRYHIFLCTYGFISTINFFFIQEYKRNRH